MSYNMKTSNIILLTLFLFVLATVTAMAIGLRVKEDNGWYTSKGTTEESFGDMPLGTFSMIEAEGLDNVTIKQGGDNRIHLPTENKYRPQFQVVGDTLKLWATNKKEDQDVMVTVKGLNMISLRHVQDCSLLRYKGDSLSIVDDGWGNIHIDTTEFRAIRVDGGQGAHVFLSSTACATLWPELDSSSVLSLENVRVRVIRGHWNGDASLQLDAATLRNGIEHIEHIR